MGHDQGNPCEILEEIRINVQEYNIFPLCLTRFSLLLRFYNGDNKKSSGKCLEQHLQLMFTDDAIWGLLQLKFITIHKKFPWQSIQQSSRDKTTNIFISEILLLVCIFNLIVYVL